MDVLYTCSINPVDGTARTRKTENQEFDDAIVRPSLYYLSNVHG